MENNTLYYPLTIKSFSETTEKRDYPDLSSSKNPYFSKKFYLILFNPLVNH